MYKLYEKVPKTMDYLYGSREIQGNENPFKEGPCLLCISGQYGNSYATKSNFGVTKEGMKMARMRVRNHKNAGFDLKEFPVKFLSIDVDTKSEEKRMTEEERASAFVDKYLVQLFSEDEQKMDCVQAMKKMRNVNIMSYCDGTFLAQNIEEKMFEKMKEIGYTDEECDKIQSQMCVIPFSTNRLDGTQKSTCISFGDINDDEVNDNITEEEIKQVKEGKNVFKYSDNEMAYLFDGNGYHELKKYTELENEIPIYVSSVITKVIENSINNFSSEKFEPISAVSLVSDLDSIKEKFRKGKTTEELMNEIDNSLEYNGARRISNYEAELLDRLDECYDEQIRMQRELSDARKIIERKSNNQITMQNLTRNALQYQNITIDEVEKAKNEEIQNKFFEKGADIEW